MSARGSGTSSSEGPRTSVRRPTASSSSRIQPAFSPVAGSKTSSPGSSLCSCAGYVNACTSERARFTGSEPSGSSSPIASESWTSSAGLLPSRVEERPPDGLRLAPVVLQELRGQVARALVVGEGVRVVGEIGEELGAQPLALGERLGRLLAHLARLLGLGPRELPPVLGLGLGPPLEQPVPEEQRREAVLLVVGADRLQELVAAGVAPLLVEEHRVRAALDLGLAAVEVEALDVLQRVGRVRGAQRVPDDGEEVDEDARRGAGRRPPPRACRRGPSGA